MLSENKKLFVIGAALVVLLGLVGSYVIGVTILNPSGEGDESPRFAIEQGSSQSITLQNTGGDFNGGIQVRIPIGNETFYGNFTSEEVQNDEFFTVDINGSADNVSSIGTIEVFKTQNGELDSQINAIVVGNISESE